MPVQPSKPDFYNWNKVKVRYCDGSSFTGDVEEVDLVSPYSTISQSSVFFFKDSVFFSSFLSDHMMLQENLLS